MRSAVSTSRAGPCARRAPVRRVTWSATASAASRSWSTAATRPRCRPRRARSARPLRGGADRAPRWARQAETAACAGRAPAQQRALATRRDVTVHVGKCSTSVANPLPRRSRHRHRPPPACAPAPTSIADLAQAVEGVQCSAAAARRARARSFGLWAESGVPFRVTSPVGAMSPAMPKRRLAARGAEQGAWRFSGADADRASVKPAPVRDRG